MTLNSANGCIARPPPTGRRGSFTAKILGISPPENGSQARGTTMLGTDAKVDIVVVPAIGADPRRTFAFPGRSTVHDGIHGDRGPAANLATIRAALGVSPVDDAAHFESIYRDLEQARVYYHTFPRDCSQRTAANLADDLLAFIESYWQAELRAPGPPPTMRRPLHFACHGTGGLIVKLAIVRAAESKDPGISVIAKSCFSIAFFGVPHYGSTVLSARVYENSIAEVLGLREPMPRWLQRLLQEENSGQLVELTEKFVPRCGRLRKIWTFAESQETGLRVLGSHLSGEAEQTVKVSVVDSRSATLSTPNLMLGSETVIQVDSQHAELPRFGNHEHSQALMIYIDELKQLIETQQSFKDDNTAWLTKSVKADVHLFYEAKERGDSSIRLWSVHPGVQQLLEIGPIECLEQRLQEGLIPPAVYEDLPAAETGQRPGHHEPSNYANITDGETVTMSNQSRRRKRKIPLFDRRSVGRDIALQILADNEDKYKSRAPTQADFFAPYDLLNRKSEGKTSVADPTADNDSFLNGQKKVAQTKKPRHSVHSEVFAREAEKGTSGEVATPGEAFAEIAFKQQDFAGIEQRPSTSPIPVLNVITPTPPPTPPASRPSSIIGIEPSRPKNVTWGSEKSFISDVEAAGPQSDFGHDEIVIPDSDADVVVEGDSKPSALSALESSDRNNRPAIDDIFSSLHEINRALENEDDIDRHRDRLDLTYKLPDVASQRFKWIHIPCNNLIWMASLFVTLANECGNSSLYKSILHPQSWNLKQNKARHGSPHGRYMEPYCRTFYPRPSNLVHQHSVESHSPNEHVQLSIYMPYLHWDTFDALIDRNEVIQKRMKRPSPYPMDEKVAKGHSIEHKLIWQYVTNAADLPLHHRRSLDQYRYPALKDLNARDRDQVLYKRTKAERKPEPGSNVKDNHIPAEDSKKTVLRRAREKIAEHRRSQDDSQRPIITDRGKVLMVDQLWCWVLDDKTVVTSFSPREEKLSEPSLHHKADLRKTIYDDVSGDPQFATRCENAYEFAAQAVRHSITVLLETVSDKDSDLQVFRIFEEYISDLTEEQTKSFKSFRDSHKKHDVQKLEDEIMVDNSQDLTNYLELRDVEDELQTLEKLFGEQTRILRQLIEEFTKLKANSPLEWLRVVDGQLQGYSGQVQMMIKSCQSAQESYKSLLDMKQKQANVDEAYLSRIGQRMAMKSNMVAQRQSRAVLVFTVFTIIFLPLSFFTSLFGMNVREWSGQSTNLPLHTVGVLMGSISAVIVVVALLLAFNQSVREVVWDAIEWFVPNALQSSEKDAAPTSDRDLEKGRVRRSWKIVDGSNEMERSKWWLFGIVKTSQRKTNID